jgi:hypothetical protein
MLINIIEDFLISQEWQYTQVDGKNILLFGISGKNGNFQCIADVDEEEGKFMFLSVCGANTPKNKKRDMLQLINDLNYKLFLGNFEMDSSDGEVRFRTSTSFKHIELNQNFIEGFIFANIVAMDKSLPSIIGLMFGEISVEKALELSVHEE